MFPEGSSSGSPVPRHGPAGGTLARAAVSELWTARPAESQEDLEDLETDLLAGFVLARASAGLADVTIRHDLMYLEQIRAWLDRPLWTCLLYTSPSPRDGL